jgi:hypothetical protein
MIERELDEALDREVSDCAYMANLRRNKILLCRAQIKLLDSPESCWFNYPMITGKIRHILEDELQAAIESLQEFLERQRMAIMLIENNHDQAIIGELVEDSQIIEDVFTQEVRTN